MMHNPTLTNVRTANKYFPVTYYVICDFLNVECQLDFFYNAVLITCAFLHWHNQPISEDYVSNGIWPQVDKYKLPKKHHKIITSSLVGLIIS